MKKNSIRWIGIAGSLRDGSYNRALLGAAIETAPERAGLELFDLAEVPAYNEDHDSDERRPPQVTALKDKVAQADGVLIATPEYNYSVPGVLKNAIDWLSRPAYQSPLTRKPVAIIGASMAATGAARAQQAVRQTLLGCACVVFPSPDIAVGAAHTKFDSGALIDDETRDRLSAFLADFAGFTRMVARAREEHLWPTRHA